MLYSCAFETRPSQTDIDYVKSQNVRQIICSYDVSAL